MFQYSSKQKLIRETVSRKDVHDSNSKTFPFSVRVESFRMP